MVRIIFRDSVGRKTEVDAQAGQSLMACAKAVGIDGIEAECGGSMICGTCQVYVDAPWFDRLRPAGTIEAEMMEYTLHPRPSSRLSCQIIVDEAMEGMEVEMPVAQR